MNYPSWKVENFEGKVYVKLYFPLIITENILTGVLMEQGNQIYLNFHELFYKFL